MQAIRTPEGQVILHEAPMELCQTIGSLLPFSAFRYAQPPSPGAENGLVMQRGERELCALKLQPADCDEETGFMMFQYNRLLIAHALAGYIQHGFSGLFLPVPYLREKGYGLLESGIACFSYPGLEAELQDCRDIDLRADLDQLMAGQIQGTFSERIYQFMRQLAESSNTIGIPLPQIIGLEVRPRSQLGSIGFYFMSVDSHLVCLQTRIDIDDPVWPAIRSLGIEEVWHLPSVPAAIQEHELRQPGE